MAEEEKTLATTSAPGAAAGPFSRYMDDSIINPLISRLDFMMADDHLRPPDPYSVALLEEITGLMRGLQELFRKIGQEEQILIKLFNPVETLIDGVFASTSASDSRIVELRPILDAVRKEVLGIRETIMGPYKIDVNFWGVTAEKNGNPSSMTAAERIGDIRDCEEMGYLRRAVIGMDLALKRCLLCLAAFPVGALIRKRLLIHWWIGEKFVPSVAKGEELFQNLVCLRFVLIPREHQQKAHLCTVHPWIHRVLVSVAKAAAFLEIDSNGNCSNDFERTNRACLRKGKMLLSGSVFHPKVAAIYNIDQSYVKLSTGWFTNKQCLLAVQLGQWRVFDPSNKAADAKKYHVELINEEQLKDIEACKNLRYLSLRGISGIKAIPDAVGSLCELIVLDLRACHNLQVLTKEITKLHKLQYLDVSECYLLVDMPGGLAKMSSLQVLKGFVVASSSKKNACRLTELVSLKNLRKLSISISTKIKPGKYEFEIFAQLEFLKQLKITWGVMPENTMFSLPPNIEKLDLQCFPSKKFRDLFTTQGLDVLKSVNKLYVTGGMLESLEPLDKEKDSQRGKLRLRFLKLL